MKDPVDERLRSYYESIQEEMPAGLEARVVRAMNETDSVRATGGPGTHWRPAFGLVAAAAGATIVIVALLARGLTPAPTRTGVVGPSASPSVTPLPVPTDGATPTPALTPTPTPTPEPTPTPLPSGLYSAGTMPLALSQTTATLLVDGRVLIAGGTQTSKGGLVAHAAALAEIYDPATGKFTQTGSMAEARIYFAATLLADGRVLVTGGADLMDGIDNLKTAEIYDPSTGKFTRTGSMAHGRANHTATLLSDGRVLIAGGYGGGTEPLAAAEIYDPSTGKFTATGSMTVTRSHHTATLLADGRVLLTGGQTASGSGVTASAEIYDPGTGKFTATGSMSAARYGHSVAPLMDGRVLVAGGRNAAGTTLASAEIYDPSTGKFTAAGSMTVASETLGVSLADGRVLVVLGNRLDLYDPGSGSFSAAGTLAGTAYTATAMANGQVLLTEGGKAQLYQP